MAFTAFLFRDLAARPLSNVVQKHAIVRRRGFVTVRGGKGSRLGVVGVVSFGATESELTLVQLVGRDHEGLEVLEGWQGCEDVLDVGLESSFEMGESECRRCLYFDLQRLEFDDVIGYRTGLLEMVPLIHNRFFLELVAEMVLERGPKVVVGRSFIGSFSDGGVVDGLPPCLGRSGEKICRIFDFDVFVREVCREGPYGVVDIEEEALELFAIAIKGGNALSDVLESEGGKGG